VGFEPTISAGERPQTYVLDRSATETGYLHLYLYTYYSVSLVPQCKYLFKLVTETMS
jgi:hypothetical protein